MGAYYNENDKFAAAWLRELIRNGVIEDGEVDERDIRTVCSADLRGFSRCHFFAGIGVWSYPLIQARFPENFGAWTGSCPCQPFSVSGKRRGASDERHLWPAWEKLIRESRPKRIFGEQVASDDGLAWLDLVSADLEDAGYSCGAVDTCAAGFGAPQISQRLFFVAEADGGNASAARIQRSGEYGQLAQNGGTSRLAAPQASKIWTRPREIQSRAGTDAANGSRNSSADDSLAASENFRLSQQSIAGNLSRKDRTQSKHEHADSGSFGSGAIIELGASARGRFGISRGAPGDTGHIALTDATRGFWRDAEWLWCRDEKYRPVEPGTFPLAHGAPCRVGRLRGYGNALVAPQAIAFVKAYLELRS